MKKIIGYIILALIFPMVFGAIGCVSRDITLVSGITLGLTIDFLIFLIYIAITFITPK